MRILRFIFYGLAFVSVMLYLVKGQMQCIWFSIFFLLFAGVLKDIKK